jgi:hypothetical protein
MPVELNELAQVPVEPAFDGDDDIRQQSIEPSTADQQPTNAGSPAELVNLGMSFFSQLTQTLASPEATKELIATIVQKDDTDGKTYLKIPIENQKIVENAFALFAGLLGSLKK